MDTVTLPQGILEAAQKYEGLRVQEKRIKAEQDMLKPALVTFLTDSGADIELEQGAITLKQGKTAWEYSEAVEKAEEALEKLKEEERQKGIATEKVGAPYVEYRAKK